MFKKLIAVAAVVVGAMAVATPAMASEGVLPAHGNSVVNVDGTDYFQVVNPVWNAPVNAGVSDTADDNFSVLSSGPNSVRFNVTGTNLCVADPGPGYGNVDAIVLRTCNGKQWQAFRVVDRQSNGFASLQSVATNQYIQDNGQLNQLTGVADNRPCSVGIACPAGTVGQNLPSGTDNQLWRFGGFFRHLVRLSATETYTKTVDSTNALNDSLSYNVAVNNDGNVDVANLNVVENASVTATVTATLNDGSTEQFTLSRSLGDVATPGYDTTVPAHGTVNIPGELSLVTPSASTPWVFKADDGDTLTASGSSTDLSWAFSSPVEGTKTVESVTLNSAKVTESPSVTVSNNGHTHTVPVNPSTEVANF